MRRRIDFLVVCTFLTAMLAGPGSVFTAQGQALSDRSPATSAKSLPGAESPILNDVSWLVVNLDVPALVGTACGPELARFLKARMLEGGQDSLDALIALRGGFWRVIETPALLQAGLFLPSSPDDGEELATVFLKHLDASIRGFQSPAEPQSRLTDLLIRRHRAAGRKAGAPVSIFGKGPLEKALPRLQEIVKRSPEPVAGPSAPIGPSLVLPGLPPTLVTLLQWDPPSPEALASAKFVGEEAARVLPENAPLKFDIWADPQGISLALIATGPIDQLYSIRRKVTAFVAEMQALSDSEKWRRFSEVWERALMIEARTLDKGAYLEAWQRHVDKGLLKPGSGKFVPPAGGTVSASLPVKALHQMVVTDAGNPRFIAVSLPMPRDRIDVFVHVRSLPVVLRRLNEKLSRRSLPDTGPLAITFSGNDSLAIRINCQADRIAGTLGILRTQIFECVVTSEELSQAALNPEDSLRKIPGLIICGAGGFEAYEILGILKEGWPLDSGRGILSSHALSLAALTDAAKSFLPTPLLGTGVQAETLRGIWETRTATSAGMAEVLGTLLGKGLKFSSLAEITSLFNSPAPH